jgi:hypothetical protein
MSPSLTAAFILGLWSHRGLHHWAQAGLEGEMSSILGRGKMTARPAGVEWMSRRWLQPPARENLHGARGNCAQVRALVRRGPPNSARFGTRARKWGVRSYADTLVPLGSETVMEGKSPGAREVSAEVIVMRRREREFCYGEGEGTDNLGPPASRHCTCIWNVAPTIGTRSNMFFWAVRICLMGRSQKKFGPERR